MKSKRFPKTPENIIPNLTVVKVLHRVSEDFDVPVIDIMSSRRHAGVVEARHIAMWLSYRLTRFSFPEIGKALDRDHTSVIHGVAKIDGQIKTSASLARLIQTSEAKLKEAA